MPHTIRAISMSRQWSSAEAVGNDVVHYYVASMIETVRSSCAGGWGEETTLWVVSRGERMGDSGCCSLVKLRDVNLHPTARVDTGFGADSYNREIECRCRPVSGQRTEDTSFP